MILARLIKKCRALSKSAKVLASLKMSWRKKSIIIFFKMKNFKERTSLLTTTSFCTRTRFRSFMMNRDRRTRSLLIIEKLLQKKRC